LLVEDNPVNQEVVVIMLQSMGINVAIANNGKEAIESVQHDSYDLVLMDCMMPIVDGYTAAIEIKKLQKTGAIHFFPIIALTANAIEGDREKCLAAGMQDYLAKPFKIKDLQGMLSKWLPKMLKKENLLTMAEVNESKKDAIDKAVIQSIKSLDSQNGGILLDKVVSLYLKNAEELIMAFEDASSQGDTDKIRYVAHTLKSSSNQVGAKHFAELCAHIEQEARQNRFDSSGHILSTIRSEFENVCEGLAVYQISTT
jgi:CheY-like chemotaxis protein/HPt (histidine-containing phosphotransfer) domain-containing protein